MAREAGGGPPSPERERFEIALGERLVGEGTLTRTELARARADAEAQRLPLAVALVRLGLAECAELTRAGAAVAGLPAAPSGALAREPEAICGATSLQALRKAELRPFERAPSGLSVATCKPWETQAIAEAERDCSETLNVAYCDDASWAAACDGRLSAAEPDAPARPLPAMEDELMSESAFEALYQEHQSELPPAGLVQAPTAPVRTAVLRELPSIGPEAAPAEPPRRPGQERRQRPDRRERARRGAGEDRGAEGQRPRSAPAPELDLVSAAAGRLAPAAPQAEEVKPLTEVDDARRLLELAGDRRQLGWILTRHALAYAARVVLLEPEGGDWRGWSGAGQGVSQERVLKLRVPCVPGTIFGLVGATGGPFLGPVPEHPVHKRFFTALGLEPPGSAGLFPVHDGGELAFALYLDGGAAGRLPTELGSVLILAQNLPRALARLAQRR